VEQIRQPGYVDMMVEPHLTRVPHQAIGSIVAWLHSEIAGGRQATDSEAGSGLPAASCMSPAIAERLVPISEEPDLFGIICEPKDGRAENLPVLVLANAGSAYRVGPNRLYVLLARHLA